MLTSVRLQGFKSFTDATVKLAPLTVLIGANGSGKSNFLDAMRIVGRMAKGANFTEAAEDLGELQGVRGGLNGVCKDGANSCLIKIQNQQQLTWSVSFAREALLYVDGSPIETYDLETVLPGFTPDSAHFLTLSPDRLREYSVSDRSKAVVLEESGKGFANLVHRICEKLQDKIAYLDWLKELRPDQVEAVEVRSGAIGDLMFGIVERGQWIAAPSLSDGTLRFAALAATLFQPIKPNLLCIEEIENGMHPARLRLVLELLRAFVANGTQVIVTTHAPWLLAWLSNEELAATQIFYRGEDGASQVKSCGEHPFLMDALKNTPIEELFAEGYLEQTL
jgi:predicted ATPase